MNLSSTEAGLLRAVLAQHGVIAHVFDGIQLHQGLARPRVVVVRGHLDQRMLVERLLARGERSLATWILTECPAIVINGHGSVVVQYDWQQRHAADVVVKLIDLAAGTLAFAEHAAGAWLLEQGHTRMEATIFSLVELVRLAEANDGLIPASISASLVSRARTEHRRARGRTRLATFTGLVAVSTAMSTRTSIYPPRVFAPDRVNDRVS
ncbi:MAG: hypothetical protein ABS98_06360 [Lysobacteraceae bacterium SCN 69-48]|nr:MAG: hypothetical protein ABS98_06360 [Xanthomonadaceae bacterium SCN 69-48]